MLKHRRKEMPRIVRWPQDEWKFRKRWISFWSVNRSKENREGRCGQRVTYFVTQGGEMHGQITEERKVE